MLTFSKDPTSYLVKARDLLSGIHLPLPEEDVLAMRKIVQWAQSYLCEPHHLLGRSGPVCPYAQGSMELDHFFLTVVRRRPLAQQDVYHAVMTYREWFLEIEPRAGDQEQFKTILILFPEVTNEETASLIDGTQLMLKPEFVKEGLMIGQFHSGPPQEPGLWNADFRPLNSPLPMLVIRHMVATDLAFLKNDKRYVAAYLKIFGDSIPDRLKDMATEAIKSFGLQPSK